MFRVPVPQSKFVPTTAKSYPFSTMAKAREPLDLDAYGFVEEEYFLSGTANVYAFDGNEIHIEESGLPYTTRVLVRRPADSDPDVAWVSILNASQGYDIEDDWRRAWNYIISRRLAYVAITAKPIQISALQTFDAMRYKDLYFGGLPEQVNAQKPGWNPFMKMGNAEEGLAWDIIAQTAAWLRSGDAPITPEHIFLIGQSQSAVYTNTYLTFFHNLLRITGKRTFDGYAPGVGSVLVKEINQRGTGIPATCLDNTPAPSTPTGGTRQQTFQPYLVEQADLDVPVIAVSSEADVVLFGGDAATFTAGDGPLRRHWHVSRAPHSDARSRVIPDDSEVIKSGRLPRQLTRDRLERLISLPIEPIETAQMQALENWARTGALPAPSAYFATDESGFVRDGGYLVGGIRIGLVEYPLATFIPSLSTNPVLGSQELKSRDEVLARWASFDDYLKAIDEVDDALQEAGYLEPVGRAFIHQVAQELWGRIVDSKAAPMSSPQSVI
ncbi:alpha/beta hydrolase domain-containing protein [Trueperella pyogenes]|uniref:alpha/beta hydrolase domain-containing protein n=1 Tax=Trueperella pyogenes TaxID=1661 RepID=UPI0032489B4A